MSSLSISSEIGRLRRVIIHVPGSEIEAMTPSEAEQDLYNDIIPLSAVLREYKVLKDFLGSVTRTFELGDLLADCLRDSGSKHEFLSDLGRCAPVRGSMEELMALPAEKLAASVIEGIPAPPRSLARVMNDRSFISRPLPNTYFMRDSAAVFGDCVISAATAFDVRMVESLITRFIFTHHPEFMARTLIFDGPSERNRFVTVEGGDLVILSRDTMAIGISERTTAHAVEAIARNAARIFESDFTVFAVELPQIRAAIHLDMVFTVIDRDAALVFEPLIMGKGRAKVIRIDAGKGGKLSFSEQDSLIGGLKKRGFDLEPICCGGGIPVHQDREQWWSGANSFALAPGKIIMYSCNGHTMDALDRKGFALKPASDFVDGKESIDSYGRLAVSFDGIELARGGGGARCMTLPVERDEI